MIEDEEDDEEILKKGITLKSVLKHLLVLLFILGGALVIYIGFGLDQWTAFLIGFTLMCFGSMLMQVHKESPEPLRQTLSILICALCGLTKVRNYETGDFVFRTAKDKCNKCNNLMKIKQIYTVKLKKPIESKKKVKIPKLEPAIKK